MALSKADQDFYEEKLSYKSIGYLFGSTSALGTILFPTVILLQDADPKSASASVVVALAVEGFLFGAMVAAVMYMVFKFLLSMGWLPARR